MKQNFKQTLLLLSLTALLTACAQSAAPAQDGADNPGRTITVWTYYNGQQLAAFNAMVDEFNETVGREEGIFVASANLGSVNDLETAVMNAAEGVVGADPMPNIFSAYADTAYAIDRMGYLVNLDDYLSAEDLAPYIDHFIEEGRISPDGTLKIFPVAKSTEVFLLNETDWQPFARATGATYDDLATVEGIAAVAERYYNWTDEQTPEPNDGKAFFGRDAMANYFLVGASQLGVNIIEVENGVTTIHFDRDALRRLWDNYYIPYIKGYYASSGRFRSDDLKTGNILCYVGSSASATYFPDDVMIDDTSSHSIDMTVLPLPVFEGGEPYAVQQGAGMVVTKSDPETEAASVRFLQWFTESERNIRFSIDSAYMPVRTDANDMNAILGSGVELTPQTERILTVAIDTIRSNTLYVQKAFSYGTAARELLEYSMSDLAVADRERVVVALSGGTDLESAVAPYVTDTYFDTWYEDTLERLVRYAEESNRGLTAGTQN